MPSTRPNILFLFSDEHRPDAMGCAGNAVIRTPNLDSLAASGTRLSNMYCQSPLCQPSRASIVTGRYVRDHRVAWNLGDLDPSLPTMPKQMQAAGYTTAVIGKTHFYSQPPIDKSDLRNNEPFLRQFGFDYALEEFDAPHWVPEQFSHVWIAPFRGDGTMVTPYQQYLSGLGLWDTYLEEVRSIHGLSTKDRLQRLAGLTSEIPAEHSHASFTADRAIDWLNSYRNDKPFCLWLSFSEPHPPFIAPRKWVDIYDGVAIPRGPVQPPTPLDGVWGSYLQGLAASGFLAAASLEFRENTARHYYALISEMDHCIGRVIQALEQRGLAGNTWIVYSSDHGEMLGDHNLWTKLVFYRQSAAAPAIIRPPAGRESSVLNAPAQSIDLTATLLDIAGAAPPDGSSGRSLLPLLQGHGQPREAVFSELAGLMGRGAHFVMTATERYRYVWERDSATPCELFDLHEDPDENVNLVTDPGYKQLREDLQNDFVSPFLAGQIG